MAVEETTSTKLIIQCIFGINYRGFCYSGVFKGPYMRESRGLPVKESDKLECLIIRDYALYALVKD